MRIVHTVERYAPEIGGAERVIERISTGLVQRGHEVVVVTSGRRSSEIRDGVRVERFSVGGNLARGFRGDPRPALELIRDLAPDILMNYAAQTWPTDACLPFLDEARTFAHALAPCGFSGLGSPRYAAYFDGMRWWLPRYDALIFHSDIYQDWHFATAVGATQMHVIPNGADPPTDASRFRDSLAQQRRVVTVGSHVRSKGHGDFIRLIDELGPEMAHGTIVAPPRLWPELFRGCYIKCLAASALRPRLSVLNGSDRSVAAAAIDSADVLVLPSQIECAPLVILEAMAAGVPWVSYDVGNVRELEGGVVVRGLTALIAATRRLLQEPGGDLGAAGQAAWSAHHRWDRIVTLYEKLYSALAPRGGVATARGSR